MTRLAIPLKFRKAPTWPTYLDPPALQYSKDRYAPGPGGSPQPVLDGRDVLRPDVDLNDYKCDAVIDWIEVRLRTPDRRQALNVQRRAKKLLDAMGSKSTIFVSGPDRKKGYIGNDFILRIQQPVARELMEFLEGLLRHYRPHNTVAMSLSLAGIEVSVDFRVKPEAAQDQDASNLLRWRMTDVLSRHLRLGPVLTEEVRCDPRFYTRSSGRDTAKFLVDEKDSTLPVKLQTEALLLGVSSSQMMPLRLASHRATSIDTTSYVGAKEFPVMLRVMDKTTDRRDPSSGKVDDLPSEDWRARIEVRLKDTDGYAITSAMELNTISDLYGYDFKKLRKPFFEFFLPTIGPTCDTRSLPFSVTANETDVFARSGVYGLDRLHRSIEAVNGARYAAGEVSTRPAKLRKKGRLMSYVELNRKADRALKRLSGIWQGAASPLARSTRAAKSKSA